MKRTFFLLILLSLMFFEACKTSEEGCLPRQVTPCPDQPVISYEGQTYNTVLIGDQCWMAENLNIGKRIDFDEFQTDNQVIEKHCYEDMESNCNVYGGLYRDDEAMQYLTQGQKGICPEGWHIPTDEEWKILEGTVDSKYGVGDAEWDNEFNRGHDAGKNLKSIEGWDAGAVNCDLFGFNALPGGCAYSLYGDPYGYYDVSSSGYFLTSTRYGLSDRFYTTRSLHHDLGSVSRGFSQWLCSVRCIKDE